MSRLGGLLTALGLAVAMTGWAAQPGTSHLPDPKTFVELAQSGKLDPETYDFDAAGFFTLPDRMAWQMGIFGEMKMGQPDSAPECSVVGQRNAKIMAWTQTAAQSADAKEWSATVKAMHERLAKLDQVIQRSAPEKTSASPLVHELMLRYARDQDVRGAFSQSPWKEDVSPALQNNWILALITRVNAIDCDNTEWLKSQLAKIGWFSIPKYGADADMAAWHLVQHADRNPRFQREMLDKLQSLPAGETDGKRLGYLWDRVARAEGHLQRYGTQGNCKDGQWTPFESEDPAHLDERRASVGMEPIAEHMVTTSREACPH
jgi:hypothetical protein